MRRGQTEPIVVTSSTVMMLAVERLLQQPSIAVSASAGLLLPERPPIFLA